MTIHRTGSTAAGLLAAAALAASALPATAQEEPSFTPEEIVKLQALTEFMGTVDDFLPTVNHYDPASLPVTFPMRELRTQIVADVAVGDGEPQQFMLDTGAPTIVTQDVADAQGGETIVEMANIAGGGIITFTPLKKYPSLTIAGALTITDAAAQSPWEAAGSFHCVAPGGLLGSMSMRNAVWQFDYGADEVNVAASIDDLDHVEDAIAVPFTPGGGLSPTPHVTLPVGDAMVDFLVDTGGGIPLAIDAVSLEASGVPVPENAPRSEGIAAGAGGTFASQSLFVDLPITFGDTELIVPGIISDTMSPGAEGNIGHAFLRNFVVTIDWSTNTMYLEPLFEGDTVPHIDEPPAAAFQLAGDQLIVGGMVVGGPAAEAGLQLGEVITAVDGQSVEGITIDDYCALREAGSHETITTETGTYDASPVEGFFSSMEE